MGRGDDARSLIGHGSGPRPSTASIRCRADDIVSMGRLMYRPMGSQEHMGRTRWGTQGWPEAE